MPVAAAFPAWNTSSSQTALHSAYEEGARKGELEDNLEGKIKLIRTLQGILGVPAGHEEEFRAMGLEQLEALTSGLQEKLRER